MDNREADIHSHPPSCSCVDCVQKRLARVGYTPKTPQTVRHDELESSINRLSRRRAERHPTWRKFSWTKLLLDILLLVSLVGLGVTGYFAFGHKVAPLLGTFGFLIFVILFACLVSLTKTRRYKHRTPSFALVFWCSVGMTLVAAFAGVQPLADYKDTTFSKIATWWETSKITTQIPTQTAPTNPATPAVILTTTPSAVPSITSSSIIDKASDSLKNLWNTDTSDYIARFNEYRQSKGLVPLVFTDDLNQRALMRLTEIKLSFSHYSAGQYNRHLAENIVEGISNNQDALRLWQNSPGHNANMLNPEYKYSGYAAGDGHAIQLFTEWTVSGHPK